MSNQDVSTPPEFLEEVRHRFGALTWDLAATRENSVTGPAYCYTPEDDSLSESCPWEFTRAWLNPPFKKIGPWVKKASETSKNCGPLVILPAAVCTGWFLDYVYPFAKIYLLNPRVFMTEIRDCILVDYQQKPGIIPWVWR